MVFLGSIDYLVPALAFTWVLGESIDNVLIDSRHNESSFRVHFDRGGLGGKVKELEEVYGERVSFGHWSDPAKRGPASVRNKLARESDAEFLVFVDSDVELPPHFDRSLRSIIPLLERQQFYYPSILGRNQLSITSQFFEQEVMRPQILADGRWMATTAVLGVFSERWRELPDFDERYSGAGGEDYHFFLDAQALKYGSELYYDEKTRAFHENPESLGGLARRARRYAAQAHLHSDPPDLFGFASARMMVGRNILPLRATRATGLSHLLYFILIFINRELAARASRHSSSTRLHGLLAALRTTVAWVGGAITRSPTSKDWKASDSFFIEKLLGGRTFGFDDAGRARIPAGLRNADGNGSPPRRAKPKASRGVEGSQISRRQYELVKFFWGTVYGFYWRLYFLLGQGNRR